LSANPRLAGRRALIKLAARGLLAAAVVVPGATLLLLLGFPGALRAPAERVLSARLDRHVTIGGLRFALLPAPSVRIDGLAIDSKPGAAEVHLAEADRIRLTISPRALLHGRVELSEASLDGPRLWLAREQDGSINWNLGPRGPARPHPDLPVEVLHITRGSIHYRDAVIATEATITVDSGPPTDSGQPTGSGPPTSSAAPAIRFHGNGQLHDQPLTLEGAASAPPGEGAQPYSISLRMSARDGGFTFHGEFSPFNIDRLEGDVELQGRDLSDLYPAVPVPLPWTPPYQLSGRLTRNIDVWSLSGLQGRLGQSDLAGSFSLDVAAGTGRRPAIRAELVSHSLRIQDLGGFVGIPPGGAAAAEQTPEQQREAERRKASGKMLPSSPIRVERLRHVDADIQLTGEHIQSSRIPLENMRASLHLHGGILKLTPLDFGLAGGHVQSTLEVDASGSPVRTHVDITMRDVNAEQLVPAVKPPAGGRVDKLGGDGHADMAGTSVAEMLGSMDGRFGLIMWQGQASTLALAATNLDLARVAALIISGDDRSTVRCVAGAFEAQHGVLSVQQAVIDTSAVKIDVTGDADFKAERYDLRLEPDSKKPSPLALRGPINIGGTFAHPSVGPALGHVAVRAGAAAALGVVNPLLALLPLVDFGGAKDADCRSLAEAAERAGGAPSSPQP
jgi:uncharacterized protein involved in outer membrane biogenesis